MEQLLKRKGYDSCPECGGSLVIHRREEGTEFGEPESEIKAVCSDCGKQAFRIWPWFGSVGTVDQIKAAIESDLAPRTQETPPQPERGVAE